MEHQTFYIKTYVRFIVAGDINFPYKHSFAALNIFVWFTVTFSLTTHTEALLCFHCNSGYSTAPKCYIARLLPIFFLERLF